MSGAIRKKLEQRSFESAHQEAILSLLVCADEINRRMEAVCQDYGITATQYNVLRILRGVYPNGHARCDIIKRMIHQAPDVTRLISRLEQSGFVRRGVSENDGRLSVTTISAKGLKLLAAMAPAVAGMYEVIVQSITERDAKVITRICDRIYGG
jgi:DNA-binding MarR family transcriptional regulator